MNSDTLHLRPFEHKDSTEVEQLINNAFGKAYIQSKPNLFELPILLVAAVNDKIIGFCSGEVLPENIGLLDVLVVHSKHAKKGVGTALFKERMLQFSKMKINNFILNHWIKRELPKPNIAINHGFILKDIVPNYWAKDSLDINYNCAECGTPPCNCSCAIYTKS